MCQQLLLLVPKDLTTAPIAPPYKELGAVGNVKISNKGTADIFFKCMTYTVRTEVLTQEPTTMPLFDSV